MVGLYGQHSTEVADVTSEIRLYKGYHFCLGCPSNHTLCCTSKPPSCEHTWADGTESAKFYHPFQLFYTYETHFLSLTFRMVLASTRGSSCTKMQAPLAQAEKSVQAAFTQPVSVVFQKMSDSVKAIHCLSKMRKSQHPPQYFYFKMAVLITLFGSLYRVDPHLCLSKLYKNNQVNHCFNKHLLRIFKVAMP